MRLRIRALAEETKSVKLLLPVTLLERFDRVNEIVRQRNYVEIDLATIVSRLVARELASVERQLRGNACSDARNDVSPANVQHPNGGEGR